MFDVSLAVRIGAMFVIFGASAAGFMTPIWSKDGDMNSFNTVCMKSCGAGVMMGIALIHLMPDANQYLSAVVTDYDLAFAVAAFGIFLIVAIEQIAIIVASKSFVKGKRPLSSVDMTHHAGGSDRHHHKEDCGLKRCDCDIEAASPSASSPPSPTAMIVELADQSDSSHKHETSSADHDHSHADDHDHDLGLAQKLMQSGDSVRDMVMVYALELSIAIHSIIIGVDIGLLSRSGELVTLITLVAAICFHQYIEGFSIGVSILAASNTLTREGGVSLVNTDKRILMFVLIFSTTAPLGILIGILTSTDQQTSADLATKGCANALAAGSLMYISLAEMIGVDFNRPHLKNKPMLRLAMLGSLFMGVLFTAVLAIWA
jgi:solute carrier family 39 (zinc transporter), member 1/2/3